MSKEFVWNIEIEGEEKIFKCVVLEDEVVTYEGDTEHKHLKITDPTKKVGVLQIDTVTKVFDMDVPFQLENGIPYLKLGKQWTMSATTFEERKQKIIMNHKITAIVQGVIGIGMCLAAVIRYFAVGDMGNWWFLIVLGSIMGITGAAQYKDLKDQLKLL